MSKHFISFEQQIQEKIDVIIADPTLHGLWLNTLSYLENCGARKIASCEHPTTVKEEMLKHAAEEFRHAFYLKKQLGRINQHYQDYRRDYLLGGWRAYHYLYALDVKTCRYLKDLGMDLPEIKHLSYLLVTYAIELRAAELYPVYQSALKRNRSKVQVQSILLEEEEHLKEMQQALSEVKNSPTYVGYICHVEALLFEGWLSTLLDAS